MIPTAILIDARNAVEQLPILAEKIAGASFIGIDLETHDQNAHEGIKAYRKNDTAKVFDYQRTTITGVSFYIDGDDKAYYVNLAHADVENRIDFEDLRPVMDAKKPDAYWIAHNAPFELTNLRLNAGYFLKEVICTLQMCVSTYGPDDYSQKSFREANLGAMGNLAGSISREFWNYERGADFTSKQGELWGQIAGKQSAAAHSYNGWVRGLTFGYGLKKAVKSHFGHQMTTFDEALGGKAHMGELTGEEAVAYGADDAYWAVRLFHRLLMMMVQQNDTLVKTFFEQENPMIHVFSDIACEGMVLETAAVFGRRELERHNCATALRELKKSVRALLPFPSAPNATLVSKEKWYASNFASYRANITKWAMSADDADDLMECVKARGPVTNAWYSDTGGNPKKLLGPNLSHYMPVRTLIYDLLGAKIIYDQGKVQSDAECRGKIYEKLKTESAELTSNILETYEYIETHGQTSQGQWDAELSSVASAQERLTRVASAIAVIEGLNKLASIEQAMKLYLTPYTQLMDPDTGRVYPIVSSMLATRRMAASFPNPMQLAKRGETVYVRSFFKGDNEDHLLVSLDWSQVELVIIGDQSGDPEFAKAYGQLPYQDMHKVAAADLLASLYDPNFTVEQFDSLRTMADDVDAPFGFPLVDEAGRRLTPKEAYKFNRGTPGGKGMNFGYWYSGALGSVGNARGLTSSQMWALTDAYRERFAVAEAWRVGVIQEVGDHGFVTLPDGHRRNRFEATMPWAIGMKQLWGQFGAEGTRKFADVFINKIARRAGNQTVNSLVQGTCATLAKRSILAIRAECERLGIRAFFRQPIHDEVLFSVHKDDVMAFLRVAKAIMTNHPDIVKTLKLHCTASVGRNFGPFHSVSNPFGQIELDEAPKGLTAIDPAFVDKALPDDQVQAVLDYLTNGGLALAA
jgi:DNA polymerase I-like protein with 3'-5' exonuclease and polymerase domains